MAIQACTRHTVWRKLVTGLLLILAVTACSHTQINSSTSTPSWLESPGVNGHLAVIGSAMPQNIGGREGQYRTALTKARAELAKVVRVHVKDVFKVAQISSKGETQIQTQSETQIRAFEGQRLDQATVRAEWVDPRTGELFLWYTTPAQ